MAPRTNSRRRGASYIESLISVLVIAFCLLAVLSLFGFSMNMVDRTGDEGVAYNLARKMLESTRATGFSNTLTAEGTLTRYYDSLGGSESATKAANHRFSLTRTVTSDKFSTYPDGSKVPSQDAIRSVVIDVRRLPSNELLQRVSTHLVRSGL